MSEERPVIEIENPCKSWWAGDKRVEPYMKKVSDALDRHLDRGQSRTDIYNRSYEAVYEAIKDNHRQPDKKLVEENESLKKQIEGFWDAVYYGYLIETREEIEKDCKESWAEGTSPLAVAAHFMWKREPKVKKLVEALEDIARGPLQEACSWRTYSVQRANEALAQHEAAETDHIVDANKIEPEAKNADSAPEAVCVWTQDIGLYFKVGCRSHIVTKKTANSMYDIDHCTYCGLPIQERSK